MTPNIPNRVIAGFLSLSLGLFSVPVMPAALADGLVPVAVKDPQQEKSVTSDYSQNTTESKDANRPPDVHTSSLDDNPLSTSAAPTPATRPFSAKAAVSPDGKDVLSVEVKEGGKAQVTLTQYGQKQSYAGQYDEETRSIRIDNVKNGYSWKLSFEQSGAAVSLKSFDIIMNQTGYNYEQRFGFSGQRLSYREYVSSSTMYGSYDSLYRQAYVTDAAGRTLEHTVSINRSTYTPSMYGSSDASNTSLTTAGGVAGLPVTQYSIWTEISSVDANGRAVKTSISLYGGDEEIQGIEDLYHQFKGTLESGNIDYEAVGKSMENHPGVFMKTAGTYSGFPAVWNNLLYSVEYVRGNDGNFEARLVRNKNDYQNVDIVVSSEGGSTPDKWKKLRFKNWQTVAVEGRNYSVSYGMTYSSKNTAAGSGMVTSNGRLGKPVYGLSFSTWFQDPVSKTWMQDQVIVENFPENRRAVIGGKEYDIEVSPQGIITLKIVPQTNPALEALRLKIAAMIEAASADMARFEEAADEKIHQAEEMALEMNPLAGEVSRLFSAVSGFENIPGMEALKGEAQKIYASVQQGITGVEGIMNFLRSDAGHDQQDIAALNGYIAQLRKIAESLVPGTDPNSVQLPVYPPLAIRDQARPSVVFVEVIASLKGAIVSLGSLHEKAEALRAAHKIEVEKAAAFAKSLYLNAVGNLNLDLNGDGLINQMDRMAAQAGYAHALKYLSYLSADLAGMLDLNRDGKANVDDLELLLQKIMDAFQMTALRSKIAAMMTAAVAEIAQFEEAADSKIQQAGEMRGVMKPLSGEVTGLFNTLGGFENIPGMEAIKAEGQRLYASAQAGITGVEGMAAFLEGDAALDLEDSASLEAYVAALKKVLESLVPGSDPSNVQLPAYPALSIRAQYRPSVNFEEVIKGLKETVSSLKGLIEKAEALRASHGEAVEMVLAFAERLTADANGALNVDLNGDGKVTDDDFTAAKLGYTQAFNVMAYLPDRAKHLLDLNADAVVDQTDLGFLIKRIALAMDKEGPVIENVSYPSLTRELKVKVSYTADGIAMEQVFELGNEGENRFVITARDEAGNITEVPVLVIRDTLAPRIALASDLPRSTNASLINVIYTIDDQKMEKTFQLTAGQNELRLTAEDAAGNKSELVFSVFMDNTAPVIRIVSEIAPLTNQPLLVVQYAVEEGTSSNGNVMQKEFTLAEGLNELKITAVDEAGNVGVYEFKVTLDTVPPAITGVEHPRLTNKDQVIVSYFADGVKQEAAFALENEGENVIVIRAVDKAGNRTEEKVSVIRDTKAPEIILGAYAEVTKDEMFTMQYTVDGEPRTQVFKLAAGINELFVRAEDEAGNTAVMGFKVKLDTSVPVILVVTEIPEMTNQKRLVVKYFVESGNADGGVIQKAEFDLVEGLNKLKIQAVNAAGTAGVYEFAITLDTIAPEVTGLEYPRLTREDQIIVRYQADGILHEKGYALEKEGENTFVIRAEDKAGNVTEVKIVSVRDTTPPVLEHLTYAALTNKTSAVVKFHADGQPQEREYELAEGENTFVLKVTDEAGNEASAEVWIVRDTKAPVISSIQFKSLTNQKVEEIVYLEDGVQKKITAELTAEGKNEIRISARDEAGNESFADLVITRDTTAPVIEMMTEIPSVTASAFLSVRYRVDGGDAVEKMFQFVEGMNTILIEVMDEAGNTGRSETYQIEYRPEEAENHVPVANGASFKVDQDGRLTGFVTGSDEDGDVLRYGVAEAPKHGTLELNEETGAFVFTPEAGFSGQDSFSFTVKDAEDISEAAVVAIEIARPGSAPVFEAIPDQSLLPLESLAAKINLQLAANDPEGDVVTFAVKEILKNGVKINMPERMLLTVDGAFSWNPEPAHAGSYVITFAATDAEGLIAERQMNLDVKTPAICTGNSEACNFLKTMYSQGLAAGNVGDYYHNRDGFHTNQALSQWPQLSRMSFGWAAEYATYPDRVIIGNSSTSGGQPGTSNPGSLESVWGASATYNQYRANALYTYPEHIDHDLADYYVSNNTYVKVSQGSSGSENDEVRKYFYTLAAFRPEVKAKLKEEGLLMPTMEMIFRLTRVGSDEDRYLTGEAHPRAFNDSDNMMAMVRMANAMTLDDIPAFAQIKVVEDNYGTGGNFDNKTEKQYDTPSAVSRVHRDFEYTKTMIVDAGESFDVNGNPLQFEWRVLRGDEDHVRITKMGEGTLWKIEIDYQNEATAPGSSLGSTILSNRVDIGLFINNGHTWSAPAFISSSTLRNEERDYDENGVLKEIRYNANAMSAQLGYAKGWVKDVFHENGGWTRTMADGKTIDFSPEGYQVLTKDALGRPLSAKEVKYAYNSGTRKIGFTASGSVGYYDYAGDDDFIGRLSVLEVTTPQGVVYRGRMVYSADGKLTAVQIESTDGQVLSSITFNENGTVSLLSADGSISLRIDSNRTLAQLIEMGGSSASVLHIMFKSAELMAAEAGLSAEDFELRNMSMSASPETAPYDGYAGNMNMLFRNLRDGKDIWVYSWTNRQYPLDLYPDYPSRQGFHIAITGADWSYTYHDFSHSGILMGTRAADYETKVKIRNAAAFQFEKDSGLDAGDYVFIVQSSGDQGEGDSEGEGNSGGYDVEIRKKDGTAAAMYHVKTRTYYSGGGTVGNAGDGAGGKSGTMYVIQDLSKPAHLFGYILVNSEYVLAWESHDGIETCHITDVCSGLR